MRGVAIRLVVVAVAAGLAPACGSCKPTPGPYSVLINCPQLWGCGTNAANMGTSLVFHEIDASGKDANDAGLRYVSFADKAGNPLQLDVKGHELIGTPTGGTPLTGTALQGATITLDHNGSLYVVRIRKVGHIQFW